MLTNQPLWTPTAPDSPALLHRVVTPEGGIPHPWKLLDAPLGAGPLSHDGGAAAYESNWSQALRMLGLKVARGP